MPEATFQAWFAHYLIGPFALRRVAWEPDFNPRESTSPHAARFNTSVHLDVVIAEDTDIQLPRRAAREIRGPGGWDSLTQLSIISEMKIGSSTQSGFTYEAVAQDYGKLSMFLDEADSPKTPLTAFMCIMDNHPTRKANPATIRKRLDGCRPEIRTLWWSAHGTPWNATL